MSAGTRTYDNKLRVRDERLQINKAPADKIDRKAVDSWTILIINPGPRTRLTLKTPKIFNSLCPTNSIGTLQ